MKDVKSGLNTVQLIGVGFCLNSGQLQRKPYNQTDALVFVLGVADLIWPALSEIQWEPSRYCHLWPNGLMVLSCWCSFLGGHLS